MQLRKQFYGERYRIWNNSIRLSYILSYLSLYRRVRPKNDDFGDFVMQVTKDTPKDSSEPLVFEALQQKGIERLETSKIQVRQIVF